MVTMLPVPDFSLRLKEKGTLAKDVWGVIGSALVPFPHLHAVGANPTTYISLSVRDLMLVCQKV